MTTYNTGNPLGSTDPQDLYDNAENLDYLANGTASQYPDRFGVQRKSWAGMEAQFLQFLDGSSYQLMGDYAAGITLTARNQVVLYSGEYYRLSAAASVPYTLTGTWATDSAQLVGVGDAVLRQDLAASTGWERVGAGGVTLKAKIETQAAAAVSHTSTADGAGRSVPDANHFVRYDLRDTKRPKPGALSWLPFEVLGFQANGKVAVSKTAWQIMQAIASLANASDDFLLVDQLIGTDAVTAFNQTATAIATPAYGVSLASYKFRISAGSYIPWQVRSDQTYSNTRVRSFLGSSNPVGATSADTTKYTVVRVTGDAPTALTWAADSNTMAATLTTSNIPLAITTTRRRDDTGRPVPLRKRASISEAATSGGWYFDSATKKLYVRHGVNSQFDANVKPSLDIIYGEPSTSTCRVQGAEAYFENILFVGVYPWVLADGVRQAKAVFKNCAFWFSPYSGVGVEGGYAVLDGCEIYRPVGDGVGSHVAAGYDATHVLINTDCSYAGDFDTYGAGASNQNGASMHENGRSAVLGGTLRKSCGPNLIDTGSGSGSTGSSWWFGVHAEDSLGANPTNFETYGVRTVWMEACSERGDAAVPARSADAGTVMRYGANAVRGYTAQTSGVVAAYDPLAPA